MTARTAGAIIGLGRCRPETVRSAGRAVCKGVPVAPRKGVRRVPASSPGFLERGLVAVVFLAPFVFFRQLDDFADLPQQAFIQVTVAFFLLAWLARGFSSGRLAAASCMHRPISVAGVPGYMEKYPTPASSAPRARASLPMASIVSPLFPSIAVFIFFSRASRYLLVSAGVRLVLRTREDAMHVAFVPFGGALLIDAVPL